MIMITSVALVAVAALLLWFSPLGLRQRLGVRNYFGAAVLAAWMAAVAASGIGNSIGSSNGSRPESGDRDLISAMRAVGDVDWERAGRAHPQFPDGPAAGGAARGALEVAPVDSLIGGLETRLAAGPADAKGWALLAQSYAFVGRTDEAEGALARAVELGFDETALRARLEAATRETPRTSGNWIEQTLRR